MRKLMLTLVALIAVVTFIRAFDTPGFSSADSAEPLKSSIQSGIDH